MLKKIHIDFILNLKKQLDKKFKNKLKTDFTTKKDFQVDPVTKLDYETEYLIRKSINKNFNNHQILGEEYSDQITDSDYEWIIDPIDGTKSMILGLPNWSNLIGLYYKKKCILSFANFPKLNCSYLGYRSKVFLLKNGKKKSLKCNKHVKYGNEKLVINTLHSLRHEKIRKFIMKFKGFFKVSGVDALNFCKIAEGKIDVLIESGLKKVDIFPIVCILKNSGAIITDWKGKQTFPNGDVLVTTNKDIHNKYLNILR